MGLTIHYHLKTTLSRVEDIRQLLEGVRQYALDLPFKEVEGLVEFQGKDVFFQQSEDPNRWLKIQAGRHVDADEGRASYPVKPLHIIAFTTFPGDGCEPANFGLCRYSESIALPHRSERLRTNLRGWSWNSFCKTQYASDPACGGVANFLRCHLAVIKLLDFARKTNLLTVEVSDEGGYWEERNLEKLAREVGDWNEMIAALAGKFKDAAQALGMAGESAIAGFANFEQLEARGLARLKERSLRLFDDH